MKRLILAGGGHAHLVTLRRLAAEELANTEIILVTPTQWQYYSGMLPGWIAGKYAEKDCRIDIRPVAEAAGVKLILQPVIAIDADAASITLGDGRTLHYDVLSLDIGGEAQNPWAKGLEDKLLSAKPLDKFQADWQSVMEEASGRPSVSLAVVGGGAAGVELSLVCKTALKDAGLAADVSLVIGNSGLLHEHAPVVRKRVRSALQRADITLIDGRAKGEDGGLRLSSGDCLNPDWVLAATGARAPVWLQETKLQLDSDGFVATNAHLRSVSHPNIFATGDISSRTDVHLPRSGVHAVKAGPILAENLIAAVRGGEMLPYKARKHSLYIMASGKGTGIASWGNWSWEGRWVWFWKDFIDRRFMKLFQNMS